MLVVVLALRAVWIRGVAVIQRHIVMKIRRLSMTIMIQMPRVGMLVIMVVPVGVWMGMVVGVGVRSSAHAEPGKNAEHQQPF